MPNLFSLNFTNIFATEYSAAPFIRMEFNDALCLLDREESQQIRVLVLAEDSLYAIVCAIKCLVLLLISS